MDLNSYTEKGSGGEDRSDGVAPEGVDQAYRLTPFGVEYSSQDPHEKSKSYGLPVIVFGPELDPEGGDEDIMALVEPEDTEPAFGGVHWFTGMADGYSRTVERMSDEETAGRLHHAADNAWYNWTSVSSPVSWVFDYRVWTESDWADAVQRCTGSKS